MKLAVFYHCLFAIGDGEVLPQAVDIVTDQMRDLQISGLLARANHITVGVNGGEESQVFCDSLLPLNANVILHGLQCRNECRTILACGEWARKNPGWLVLYFHAKGCTHPPGDVMRGGWRHCMMLHLVSNWARCVNDLERGQLDMVGCHWQTPPETPPGQYIFAGNFWWAKSDFLATLPPITECPRIRTGQSSLDAMDTRFEAEVWIGSGPKLPRVRDYHSRWRVGTRGH